MSKADKDLTVSRIIKARQKPTGTGFLSGWETAIGQFEEVAVSLKGVST